MLVKHHHLTHTHGCSHTHEPRFKHVSPHECFDREQHPFEDGRRIAIFAPELDAVRQQQRPHGRRGSHLRTHRRQANIVSASAVTPRRLCAVPGTPVAPGSRARSCRSPSLRGPPPRALAQPHAAGSASRNSSTQAGTQGSEACMACVASTAQGRRWPTWKRVGKHIDHTARWLSGWPATQLPSTCRWTLRNSATALQTNSAHNVRGTWARLSRSYDGSYSFHASPPSSRKNCESTTSTSCSWHTA